VGHECIRKPLVNSAEGGSYANGIHYGWRPVAAERLGSLSDRTLLPPRFVRKQQPMNVHSLAARLVPASLRLRRNVHQALSSGEPEMHLLPVLCDPHRTSLDIGACRGVYAACLQRHSARVIAFEPQPYLAAFMRKALPRVDVMQYAVSDTESEAVLHVPDNIADGGMAYVGSAAPRAVEFAASLRIRTVTVDGLNIEEVGFMKIDVEGFELAVLQGAKRTISRDLPNLLVEAEERHRQHAVESVYAFLRPLGYEGWFVMDGALHAIDVFDQDLHQDPAMRASRLPPREDERSIYINNFVFVQPRVSDALRRALAGRRLKERTKPTWNWQTS
jgi:FkbM family methyltransferase